MYESSTKNLREKRTVSNSKKICKFWLLIARKLTIIHFVKKQKKKMYCSTFKIDSEKKEIKDKK